MQTIRHKTKGQISMDTVRDAAAFLECGDWAQAAGEKSITQTV